MPIVSRINIRNQPEQHSLTIRKRASIEDLGNISDEISSKILRHMEDVNELPSEGLFICYHNTDLNDLDLEIGFPVAHLMQGEGEIKCTTTPERKVVMGIFLGPYEDSDPLYSEIMKFIKEKGLVPRGSVYYHYLNEEDAAKGNLLIKMVVPIE